MQKYDETNPCMYGIKSLNTIEKSNALSTESYDKITEMMPTLKLAFNNKQIFRTKTEIEIGILNDNEYPTIDSKYWQCIREMDAVYNELVHSCLEYENISVDIEILNEEIKLLECNHMKEEHKDKISLLKIKKLEIEKRQKRFLLMNIKQTSEDRIRELTIWNEKINEYLKNMEFSEIDPNEHQLKTFHIKRKRYMDNIKNNKVELL